MKRCPICEQTKSLNDFQRMTAAADGRQRRCRDCANRLTREYKASRAGETAAKQRAWREANPDKAKTATDSWRSRNKDRVRANTRAWYDANREKVREDARRLRSETVEQRREALQRWKAENAERVREYERIRRAAKRGVQVQPLDLDALWSICEGRCGLCNEPIDVTLSWPHPESRSLDHIVPLSRVGAHEQRNVQWTHLRCNLQKGTQVRSA